MSSLSGKYYYEATVTDEGLCRVGWSTDLAALDLGQFIINLTMGNSRKFPIPKRGEGRGVKCHECLRESTTPNPNIQQGLGRCQSKKN